MDIKQTIEFLAKEEGLRLKAYPDPGSGGDPWTIGIGSTFYEDGSRVKPGDVITKERAFKLAESVVLNFGGKIKKAIKREVAPGQFTALLSLCYNIGPGAFVKSGVLALINAGAKPEDIRAKWEKSFITASGKVMQGLINRRKREAELFTKSVQ